MSKEKDKSGKKKVTKPVVKTKKAVNPLASKEEQERFGTSGPVNSVEMNRIKDSQKLRKETLASGGTWHSAYDDWKGNTEQDGYDAGKTDLNPPIVGGGGSGNKRNPLDDYTQQLQALLRGGSYADPYNGLMEKLSGLYGDAQTGLTTNRDTALTNLKSMYDTQGTNLAGINTQAGTDITNSMNSLETMLKNQANPYENLQAQNVDSSGQLSSFLQGQGTSDQATQDYAQVLNAQNAGSAGAFNNLAGVMRNIAGANQQGALGDVATQRTNFTTQLANNNALYKSQLAQGLFADQGKINSGYEQSKFDLSKGLLEDQNTAQRNSTTQQSNLIQMLMTAISKGGKPKKGKLF